MSAESGGVPGLVDVLEAMREVFDPELGCNIVDLGLIYGIGVDGEVLWLHLTMTTPGCPAQEYIQNGVRERGLRIPGIRDVDIDLVWEPAWSVQKMSEAARDQLGIQESR
ncbi:MAG: metal-sulfur cluster assembly factor [Steroidobacteraceae bacterium]